jgi:hypothetical protein
MIHLTNNFRRHIPRRATRILLIILLHLPTNPQIGESYIPPLINDEILRFQIPMHNLMFMQIFQGKDNAG